MIQTLLLPLDQSRASHDGLDRAMAVAARWHLTLLGQPVSQGGRVSDLGDTLWREFAVHCEAWHVDHGSCASSPLTPGTLRSSLREGAADAVWCSNLASYEKGRDYPSLLTALVHASPIMVWVSHPDSVPPTQLTVAYDGNPHAQEALMMAAGLARHWDVPLHQRLITAHEGPVPGALDLAQASDRLAVLGRSPASAEHRVGAAATSLSAATQRETLLILSAVWPSTVSWPGHDSTVSRVLEAASGSVLVCPAADRW